MPSGRERFARAQIDRAAVPAQEAETAVVTAVAATGGTDGQPLATVSYQGASLQLPHLLSYTPAVGDVVALARWAGTWLILGRPGGFPPTT